MMDGANILGVGVSAVNMRMTLDILDGWIQGREPHYICVTGVHGIMESYRSRVTRRVHNEAGLVVPDGMPLVWLSRLQGYTHVDRVYGPDLMLAVCEESIERGYTHFLYGGKPGVADVLAERLQLRFPGLKIVGTYAPPFRRPSLAEDRSACAMINRARPDIVWVGISTPKQERWMARHIGRLSSSVLIGVGAAFDFHAGLKSQAPRWVMRTGLEWLFRLLHEPVRLGPRYLRNNPLFLARVAAQLFRGDLARR